MQTAYLFDVDGTLTPSRRSMDPEFRIWFCEFMSTNDVFLVTGSDYAKTVEQLGTTITENVECVYGCSGNDVWKNGRNVWYNNWQLPVIAETFLTQCLNESMFEIRTGNHLERRPGMVNFSIIGRNATHEQRKQYIEHDTKYNERNQIVEAFNMMFGDEITATAGGETGLDIYPVGKDKAQIIDDFSEYDTIFFFGDRCDPAGNDYTLAQAVSALSGRGSYYHVDGWIDTYEKLQKMLPINA